MPSIKKEDTVKKLVEKLRGAKTTVLVNYQGLTTTQLETLRGKVKEVDGDFQIVKNTLLKRVFKLSQFPSLLDTDLFGPTALLLSFNDEVSALRKMVEVGKDWDNLKARLGFLDKEVISKSQVDALAKIPSKDQLLAKLLGLFKAPVTQLAYALKSDETKLVYLLKQKGGV